MNKYPYPVLADEGSSYKDDIEYVLTYVDSFCLKDSITFEFNIKMNSTVLKELIERKDAKIILKAQTGIYSTSFDLDILEGNCKCTLYLSDIQQNDSLKFTSYIIANNDINYKVNEELKNVEKQIYRQLPEKKGNKKI